MTTLQQLAPDLFVFTDTCNVYVLRSGDAALLIDFGDGGVLDALPSIGVSRVEQVLFTHHHREQCQGGHRLVGTGTKIGAPASERAFFESPEQFRRMQPRIEDPFTCYGASYLRPPREPLKIDHGFSTRDEFSWNGFEFWVLQTPGHSPGSTTYLLRRGEEWWAFCGDLVMDGARMHTWFDSEWDYGYAAGLQALYSSVFTVERFNPSRVFPSHGPAIEDPGKQLPLYRQKLSSLRDLYIRDWDMTYMTEADTISSPTLVPHLWQITPHLYKFTGALFGSNFNMLLSDSGHALFIDCGCWDSAWLDLRIQQMQEMLGLRQIDAIIITHMHGDHILEAPHIRDKHGAPIWALEGVADKFEHPERWDYVCRVTWYGCDPVPIDRVFQRGEVLSWEGFELTFDWLPGQTEFAAILYGRIDGKLVAFTGDNIFTSDAGSGHDAVVARNSAILEEGYIYCAEYLSRLKPDLILGGHSTVIPDPARQIERFRAWACACRDAFQALSPEPEYEYFFDPYWVRAEPYRLSIAPGGCTAVQLHVRNHRDQSERHRIEIKLPAEWTASPSVLEASIPARQQHVHTFQLTAPSAARPGIHIVTFDITLDGRRYGERFDMIVHVGEA